jgi:hypothetical protein
MRPAEDTLSTTWVEYFAGARQDQVHGAIRAIRASNLDVKPKSGFVIGNVGNIIDAATDRGHSVRILHEPEDDNKAHVLLRRWPREDAELFELLADTVWCEFLLNTDPAIPQGSDPAPDEAAWNPPEGNGD